MDVSLEVLLSTGIKRKKPSPRLSWLGQEKEAIFLVDEKTVSEINLRSGRVKKTLLKKSSVVTLTTSVNGAWLAAIDVTGKLSLWNKDWDCLQSVPGNEELAQVISAAQDTSLKLYLYVSGDGSRVLLAAHTGCVYLWETTEEKSRRVSQKSTFITGRWTKIVPQDTAVFPGITDKEAAVNAIFIKNEVLGDSCLCAFVFCSGTRLVMTFLALRWLENTEKYNSAVPYHVRWAQQDCPLDTIALTCEPVKSRGALLAVFSNNGLVLAMAVNQKDPKTTCVVFMNTINFITVIGSLRGCSSRDQQIPSRLLRSYWVGDMAWTADSLFLACMLKRGSLLLLTHTGELLTLTTSGCSVEFGPAEFIPLHPLITYRPPVPVLDSCDANDSLGSVASETDLMRQRFSVSCHPRHPYLVVSDGYMVTVLRFAQNLSPYCFMKSLLLDTAQRLETVRQNLQLVKPKKNGIKLRSLSSLKATLLKDPRKPPSVMSATPSFLQDEDEICGRLEKLILQDDDEESDDQDYIKYTAPSDSTLGRAEQGRLEFASMFDTIHAGDHYTEKSDVMTELLRIRRSLLTAWAIGVTMRNAADTSTLLHYTVGCLTHFLSILQSPKCPVLKAGKPSKRAARGSPWAAYIAVIQQCLTLLYWDVAPPHAIGHMIKLTAEAIKLILVQHQQLYSKSLLESFCLLKTVSQNLDAIYSLHSESTSATSAMDSVAHLDSLKFPVFEAMVQPHNVFPVHLLFKEPPKPVIHSAKSEKRLAVLWRLLYNQTLWYHKRLRKQISVSHSMQRAPEVQNEEKAIGFLLCHLQAELQSAGEHLHQTIRLLPVNGEEYYLLGSYKESVEFWNRQLLETTLQGGRRCGLLQTRFYLAVLYCCLYNYNLNDAQGLCDQLVREMLIRSSLLTETEPDNHGSATGHKPFEKVHSEAALAVIQSMGRFMAAYFTNQLLYVFPPHNVRVLAPLHITTDRFPRVITLQHSIVAGVVRDQNLSSVWTVEYALDLLLVGGLILEAAWLADKLGDWKMSVSMAVAYNVHIENVPDENKEKVPPMPLYLSPAHIFQEKLQAFLGQPPNSETLHKGHTEAKQFTDPIEEEDADVLFSSVQEMLKAAVMADAEILTETLHQLMESAKDLSRKLSGLVPERLYLPAPPLYCPQPSSVSEEDPGDFLLAAEKSNRQKLSGVLQRILLLLRAARCSLPAAQWYIKQIKRARKIMQKIRAKGSLPLGKSLPETLLNYANSSNVFLKAGASGRHINNLVSSSVVACFRELCALCWMLHVRDRLSISCRQYQKARDHGKLFKSSDEYDSCVTEHCFEALEWACRMLSFTRVTNCEELIQDVILSLISELPPVKKVAEIMVKAFPHPDDVRVPLREKYQSVQQRLRHSMIKGVQGEEMMSVVMHNVQRVRAKTLKRIQKNIGAVVMHLWEPALDETLENESHCYDKYSLGTTSLSRSTLTDLGRPQIYSDTDTLSDPLMYTDERKGWQISIDRDIHSGKPNKAASEKTREKSDMPSESGSSVPIVGSWEFECDDAEYSDFLDLFLSYLLERDLLHSSEPGIPFLTTFSQHLREHELNSLVFDVHTTLKRKLGRPGIKSVFRAGSCYKVNTDPNNTHSDSLNIAGAMQQTQGTTELTHALCSTVVVQKPSVLAQRYFHSFRSRPSVRSGLFGLQDQRAPKTNEDKHNVSFSSLPTGHMCDQYSYGLIHNKHFAPSEELGVELQAKYSNVAKLVEWMIRWSDRRLFWSSGKAECHVASSTAIRVKTSSAAILTSMWLLEKPYLGRDYICNVPPRECIVAPVIQNVEEAKLPYGPSMSIGNSDSERGSPSTVHEQDHESGDESVSIESSKVSVRSCGRSLGGQHLVHHEKSEDDTSVLFENTAVEQIPVLSETEDDQEDQLDTQRSPKISVSIRPVPQQMENSMSYNSEHNAQDHEEPVVQTTGERPQSEPAASASLSSPLPQSFSNAAMICQPPASTTNQTASVPDGGHSAQPGNTSEAFRQLFQDEMFRLLQLQQVNFISLMQVVGSSFAALPAVQHMLLQTSQVERNPVLNPAGGQSMLQVLSSAPQNYPTPVLAPQNHPTLVPAPQNHVTGVPSAQNHPPPVPAPEKHATTVPGSHTSQVADTEQASTRCHVTAGEGKAAPDQSNEENLQKLPELTIPSSQGTDGGKIPANLGLLRMAHSQGLPLITPPSVLQKTPTLIMPQGLSSLNGFPLLKLRTEPNILQLRGDHRPPLREAWGPANSAQRATSSQPSDNIPGYTVVSNTGIKVLRRAEENQKWAELVIKRLSKHPAADSFQSHQSSHVHQPFLKTKEKKENPGRDLFERPPNNIGMPLLHLRLDPVLYVPPIPRPSVTVPMVPPLSNAKSGVSPMPPQAAITLLKADLTKETQSLHLSSTPRLIPLENLIAFERDAALRAPGSAEGSVQLLKANIQPFEEVVKAEDSIKRQKRRTLQEKGEKKMKKTSVAFRPEDSIIKPNNFDEVVQTEDVHHDKQDLEEGNEFIIPLGTFGSVLSDQIADTPVLSVAELHYMAATQKGAPKIRDASTNTDSASKSHKDTGTECEEFPSNGLAASPPPAPPGYSESRKPLSYAGTEGDEPFSSPMAPSYPAAESPLSDMPLVMPPKLFLNAQFHDEVQSERTPATPNLSPPAEVGHHDFSRLDIDSEEFTRPFAEQNDPSVAGRHHMPGSADTFLPPHPFNYRDILSSDLPERPQLQERVASRADSVTQRLLSGALTPAPSSEPTRRRHTPRVLENNDAISRLQEMDVQLRALQSMADSMERDFVSTDMLVNTIENLATVIDPEPREVLSSRAAGVPERVLPLSDIALEELAEEEDFTLPSPADIGLHRRPMKVFISAKSDSRPSTAPGRNKNMDKGTAADPLQVTGLSDIADILGDLMAGGVSASELGLTQTQADALSRDRLRHSTAGRTHRQRAELQQWMRRKQRERLSDRRKRLEELRQQEHNPFQSQRAANSSISSKTIRQSQRVKDEKDRTLLSEHHTYRVSDAISLMQDMLSEAKQVPSASLKPRTSPASLSKYRGPHSASKGSHGAVRSLSVSHADKRRSAARGAVSQPRTMSTPTWTQTRGTATFTLPKRDLDLKTRTHSAPSYTVRRKYDPSLPGDRLSQITRRGMLAGRNRTNIQSKTPKPILKTTARQFMSPRHDRGSNGSNPQPHDGDFQLEDAYERDIVSPWEIPDEINRILNSSRNSIQSQGSLLNGSGASRNVLLDNASDSTGSILSKLDWKAIEDMVTGAGSL
ncbi:ciliogenesis and planar polarity effector 1 isoform X2 [Pseudophryne corroboree]|uniref:ciliogenesis and planar polarity effector 1 isoform X2 n=1 Tax=Pseudophryne corroboree TaxID=495146 RepID=UPI00308125E8